MQKIKCIIASILSISLASVILILFCSPKNSEIIPAKADGKILATSTYQKPTPEEAREYVALEAKKAGVNVSKSLWVLDHESEDGNRMIGDDGQSIGWFQISRKYHPEISVSCAMSLPCSTSFFLQSVLRGKITEWTTYKYCRKWYADCPF